jgi:hypothetical protein
MREPLGYLLIVVGVLVMLLPVLAWLRLFTPANPALAQQANVWDFLIRLLAYLERFPWVAIVGLVITLIGLLLAGYLPLPPLTSGG